MPHRPLLHRLHPGDLLRIESAIKRPLKQGVHTVVDEHGPHYFVAFQTPGLNWVKGVQYNEQPEFFDHVGYMTEMQKKGLTILSGPFMKVAGGLNGVLEDGGMTIFEAADYDAALKIANDDPTVKSGMLKVEVKIFWVPFHR